jgi:phosphotriesterase-related protein
MSTTDRSAGTVMTVLGPVRPEELGHVQMHEHLLCDLSSALGPQGPAPLHPYAGDPAGALDAETSASVRGRAEEPVRLDNYDWVRRHVYNRDNLRLVDTDVAVAELGKYAASGGGTVVDSTSVGLGRDPLGLARISRSTGVHVVMGAGFYVHDYHPRALHDAPEGLIADYLVRDIAEGAGDTGVRPGIIGEIGQSDPVHPVEARVLRAAVRAQLETGLTLQVHPGRGRQSPLDVVRRVEDAGGDPARLVIAHIDRTLVELDDMIALARTGCHLEFDLFGQESSYYALSSVDRPHDAQRVDALTGLADTGFGDQLVISSDICQKVYLQRYGGPGYGHILDHVLPLMRRKGWTEADIRRVTHDNPVRLLTTVRR